MRRRGSRSSSLPPARESLTVSDRRNSIGCHRHVEVRRGVIGTIRLDRPPMNALNIQVQDELREVAREVTADDDVRAVVVYGGKKVFAAGADIKEMSAMGYVQMVARAAE